MIRKGLLQLEGDSSKPGLLHITETDDLPSEQAPGEEKTIWGIWQFKDVEAAKMHSYAALRKQQVDTNLYRTDPIEAIAAIDAIQLKHEIVWTNESLTSSDQKDIEIKTLKRVGKILRKEKIMNSIGKAGLAILTLFLLAPLINGAYQLMFG